MIGPKFGRCLSAVFSEEFGKIGGFVKSETFRNQVNRPVSMGDEPLSFENNLPRDIRLCTQANRVSGRAVEAFLGTAECLHIRGDLMPTRKVSVQQLTELCKTPQGWAALAAIWAATALAIDAVTPPEARNYFAAAGYEPE